LPAEWLTPVTIVLLGACSMIYTYYGGTRAVVWTDVVQMGTYVLGGVAAIVLLGIGVPGGWPAILSRAGAAGHLSVINTSFVLNQPHTLWAGLIGGGFLSMASHGADQLIVQRLLGARSLADAKRAIVMSGVAVIVQFGLFLMIGVGLWAYYNGRTFAQPDRIFPEFIVSAMPPGLKGLIVAALTAAAMSTIASSLNSLAAATTHDLWLPFTTHQPDDPATLRAARRFTLIWAVILIGGAMLYREQGTPVVVVALSIASFTYGALLGGFFLGMLWKRAKERDAIAGMSVGLAAMSVVVFAKQLHFVFLSSIAWPWYVLIGTSITMLTGVASSLTTRSRT
jgi:Na+/proline symporter